MNHKKSHLFIAAPIPDPIKTQIHMGCNQMKDHILFRKWVSSADYHITLKFLGGVDNETSLKLRSAIGPVTSLQHTFTLGIEGLGTFGKMGSPRILWMGVIGDLTPLALLQKNLEEAMEPLGFLTENRPYRPHVTIAKNYIGHTPFRAEQLEQFSAPLRTEMLWEVNQIILYQTFLGRDPMYEAVEIFDLATK